MDYRQAGKRCLASGVDVPSINHPLTLSFPSDVVSGLFPGEAGWWGRLSSLSPPSAQGAALPGQQELLSAGGGWPQPLLFP